ncbi:MAG: ABC transporter substrate-binding protein [Pirellulales bacterium]|nr:ABC transporter substrate-binding protein [Pirellulales bacterium]
MLNRLILSTTILLVFVGAFLAKGLLGRPRGSQAAATSDCRRIVSMAPSLTETLFALGLGDRVVGVTGFCDYPPAARQKARIGAYLNPNLEAVVALDPDLVVMLVENEQSMPALGKLGFRSLAVCHQTVDGILDSIDEIGRVCGATQQARQLRSELQARMDRVRRKTAGLRQPRVLFVVERTLGTGALEDVYIAGAGGYFNRIITLAGGENAHRDRSVAFPVVSRESILQLNPEVILDMTFGLAAGDHDPATMLDDWRQLDQVDAVARGQVHLVQRDYAFVPGPRFILLVEELARLIHPEVDWGDSRVD